MQLLAPPLVGATNDAAEYDPEEHFEQLPDGVFRTDVKQRVFSAVFETSFDVALPHDTSAPLVRLRSGSIVEFARPPSI